MNNATATKFPRARVYQQLRTAHLERAHTFQPATIFYVEQNYDFDPALTDELDLIHSGTITMARIILRSRIQILEVNEPLMRQRLVRTVVAILSARAAARWRHDRVRVVAHAIENKDPFEPRAAMTLRARLRSRLEFLVTRVIARQMDRTTFGTPGAQDLYLRKLGRELRRTATRLVPELPAPCGCDDPPGDGAPVVETVTFLGAFDQRKGIVELLAAWRELSPRESPLRLTVMGKGRLLPEVQAAVEIDDTTDLIVDPSRELIHRILRTTRVLVLLSQPRPRWREQVGLPIVEALSHGCIVVSTDQTGLASWLDAHGHEVVSPAASAAEVARAIERAWESPITRNDVLDSLPPVDGRRAADEWLFTPE